MESNALMRKNQDRVLYEGVKGNGAKKNLKDNPFSVKRQTVTEVYTYHIIEESCKSANADSIIIFFIFEKKKLFNYWFVYLCPTTVLKIVLLIINK